MEDLSSDFYKGIWVWSKSLLQGLQISATSGDPYIGVDPKVENIFPPGDTTTDPGARGKEQKKRGESWELKRFFCF